jgi:hypothetical protein
MAFPASALARLFACLPTFCTPPPPPTSIIFIHPDSAHRVAVFPRASRHRTDREPKEAKVYIHSNSEPIIMEGYQSSGRDVRYYDWPYPENRRRYALPRNGHFRGTFGSCVCSYQYSSRSSSFHYEGTWSDWNGSQHPDWSPRSPETPLPRTPLLGKYIEIQPRNENAGTFRDKRMLYRPLRQANRANLKYANH